MQRKMNRHIRTGTCIQTSTKTRMRPPQRQTHTYDTNRYTTTQTSPVANVSKRKTITHYSLDKTGTRNTHNNTQTYRHSRHHACTGTQNYAHTDANSHTHTHADSNIRMCPRKSTNMKGHLHTTTDTIKYAHK